MLSTGGTRRILPDDRSRRLQLASKALEAKAQSWSWRPWIEGKRRKADSKVYALEQGFERDGGNTAL